MKLADVKKILNNKNEKEFMGYVISFSWDHGRILGEERPEAGAVIMSFPDLNYESPFSNIEEALKYAEGIKRKLKKQISNVYIEKVFSLMNGEFETEMIENE